MYYNAAENYWALSRYADVSAAARNHADFSSAQGIGPSKISALSMITSDPPHHTRLRVLVTRAFQAGVIEALAPRIESIANELIDASALARGSFDLMQDFAIPLPIRVIAELLGFDPARYSDYSRWSQALVGILSNPESPECIDRYTLTSREMLAYLSQVGIARYRAPGKDLLSLLIQARAERDALSPAEIVQTCELFLSAGSETTAALIGNTALALAAYPQEAAQVLQNTALIPSMIEEALRYCGPFLADFRTTTRPVILHGIEIPRGAKVALLLGAANRDPEAFPEPERFLATRSPNAHLAFGTGIHYCLGAPLARLEARIVASVLPKRFHRLALDPESPPVWNRTSSFMRKLDRLPMFFELR